jgi:ABC-2 type transport system permease protein
MMSFVRAVWAIYRNDLAIWVRHPILVVTSLAPTLLILLLIAAETATVGRSPVALVTLDTDQNGMKMQQIFEQSNTFRLTDANPEHAQTLFKHLDVVAVITIPADFTRRIEAHESSPIAVTINNLNLDFTDDIRRGVSDAITQMYSAQGSKNPIKVTMQESDLLTRDVEYFQFLVLPAIMFLLVTNGLMNNAVAIAEEWETRRIKELLLAPVSRSALIIGKVLAGFSTTLLVGMLVLWLGAALGWTRPDASHMMTSLLVMALVALFATGLGVALGAALQRTQVATTTSVLVAFTLFFLAGGIGVQAFEPIWLQNIAALSPLTYGVHALEQAVFYSSSDLLGRDVLVLSLSGLVALMLGVLMMRRGITS